MPDQRAEAEVEEVALRNIDDDAVVGAGGQRVKARDPKRLTRPQRRPGTETIFCRENLRVHAIGCRELCQCFTRDNDVRDLPSDDGAAGHRNIEERWQLPGILPG
ncbi:MAG TPA: hypothetical protein VNJ03_07290 [Vicinamibacterales bacterium]|nr:hypothetical protein [Vicinamibacterales bacterium]